MFGTQHSIRMGRAMESMRFGTPEKTTDSRNRTFVKHALCLDSASPRGLHTMVSDAYILDKPGTVRSLYEPVGFWDTRDYAVSGSVVLDAAHPWSRYAAAAALVDAESCQAYQLQPPYPKGQMPRARIVRYQALEDGKCEVGFSSTDLKDCFGVMERVMQRLGLPTLRQHEDPIEMTQALQLAVKDRGDVAELWMEARREHAAELLADMLHIADLVTRDRTAIMDMEDARLAVAKQRRAQYKRNLMSMSMPTPM